MICIGYWCMVQLSHLGTVGMIFIQLQSNMQESSHQSIMINTLTLMWENAYPPVQWGPGYYLSCEHLELLWRKMRTTFFFFFLNEGCLSENTVAFRIYFFRICCACGLFIQTHFLLSFWVSQSSWSWFQLTISEPGCFMSYLVPQKFKPRKPPANIRSLSMSFFLTVSFSC